MIEIEERSLKELISDEERIQEMREEILKGKSFIVKNVVSKEKIKQMTQYLEGVGKGSLPNYQEIKEGAPNFHRINFNDSRAYVGGVFHQFCFFNWNQDVMEVFELMKETYHLKNKLSNLNKEKFLSSKAEDGCISRIAFQFYPSGAGRLAKHMDPVDHHQLCVPILLMSKKGKDFKKGGVYVENDNGEKYYFDEIGDPGDVVFFNAKWPHGVDNIDPDNNLDWTSFKGRWMMLLAVNKIAGNSEVSNSKEIED